MGGRSRLIDGGRLAARGRRSTGGDTWRQGRKRLLEGPMGDEAEGAKRGNKGELRRHEEGVRIEQ